MISYPTGDNFSQYYVDLNLYLLSEEERKRQEAVAMFVSLGIPPYYGGSSSTNNSTNNTLLTKVPCPGDILADPQLAPTPGSGKTGGRNGYTRSSGTQYHDGVDIQAELNTPIYSMFDGTVVSILSSFTPNEHKKGSYGNYIIVRSVLNNGETVYLKYNHLNEVGSYNVGDQVFAASSVLGKSGSTGNAASPTVVPHVHIQLRNSNDFSSGSWKNNNQEAMNGERIMSTKFDFQGNSTGKPC